MTLDLSWLPETVEGHQYSEESTISAWRDIKERTGFKTFTEIGFNAGHSASILMSLFDDVSVISYDICMHPETIPNAEIVKEKFGDRFTFIPYNSYFLHKDYIEGKTSVEKTDLLFVDGSHRSFFVKSDVEFAKLIGYRHVVFDDSDMHSVKKHIIGYYSDEKIIKVYPYHCWSPQKNSRSVREVSMTLVDNT